MKSFEDVLAQCLTDIEAGSATIEECLARHPEQGADLAPLLRTAARLRAVPAVEPSAAFQTAAPARLANLIAARGTVAQEPARDVPARTTWSPVPRLAWITATVMTVCLLAAGTVFAARGSLPDSPLYPLKQTVEQVQIAVTPGDVRRAEAYVRLMDVRASETAAMVRRGNNKGALQASQYYARLLQQAEAAAEHVPASHPEGRRLLTYMQEHLLTQQADLRRVLGAAPDRLQPAIRSSLQRNQQGFERINARMQGK